MDEQTTPRIVKSVRVGDLVVDPLHREVIVRGKVALLTPTEFQIIALLASDIGRTFSREEIISAIWGADYNATNISIPVYVRRIREKIEENPSEPRYLQTVWHCGYRFGDGRDERTG